jgi:hypothetical protein
MGISLLSYIDNLDKTSLFNASSLNKTINKDNISGQGGAYSLKIESEGGRTISQKDEGLYINGTLSAPISFQTVANWGEFDLEGILGSLVSNNVVFNSALEMVRFGLGTAGVYPDSDLQSKKFYTGGSDLKLPISFKVLDDNDSGKPLKTAMTLLGMSMPRANVSINMKKAIENVLGGMSDIAEDFVQIINKIPGVKIDNPKPSIETLTGVFKNTAERLGEQVPTGVKNVMKKSYEELFNNDIRLTEAPPTVRITIGNWLILENMVIEDVNSNFSLHCSKYGPISAEFDVSVSTRCKLILDDSGIKNGTGMLRLTAGGGRVTMNSLTKSSPYKSYNWNM